MINTMPGKIEAEEYAYKYSGECSTPKVELSPEEQDEVDKQMKLALEMSGRAIDDIVRRVQSGDNQVRKIIDKQITDNEQMERDERGM